jgi:uncharacterized protein (DUF58 family)
VTLEETQVPRSDESIDPTLLEARASTYRLVLPERHQSRMMGDLMGRGTGSSIEYQDRKDYVPGDDMRHIDWRAFARNDRVTIKLYREEITPRIDIIADTSSSMNISPEKARMRTGIATFLNLLAQRIHAAIRVHGVSARIERVLDPLELDRADHLPMDNPLPLLQAAPFLAQGGVKIFISDFLFPYTPEEFLRVFSRADRVVFIQILSAFEAEPPLRGQVRLEDAETGQHRDVALDRKTIEEYHRRLARLQDETVRRIRAMHGAFVVLREDQTFDEALDRMLEARIIDV